MVLPLQGAGNSWLAITQGVALGYVIKPLRGILIIKLAMMLVMAQDAPKGQLGDEGDAFFLHTVTKANKFFLDESGKAERERVAKRRKNIFRTRLMILPL